MIQNWKPYQHAGILDRLRYALLPAPLAKRHFLLPTINRVGVTLLELAGLLLFTTATISIGIAQRGLGDDTGYFAAFLWIPMLATVMYRSVITLVLGISIERSMMWHGYFSLLATCYGIWHGYVSVFLDEDEGRATASPWHSSGIATLSCGEVFSPAALWCS